MMQCLGDPAAVIDLCYKVEGATTPSRPTRYISTLQAPLQIPGPASHGAPCPLKGTEGLSILLWKKVPLNVRVCVQRSPCRTTFVLSFLPWPCSSQSLILFLLPARYWTQSPAFPEGSLQSLFQGREGPEVICCIQRKLSGRHGILGVYLACFVAAITSL